MKYIILLNPGHNRIYFENTKNIAVLEFIALCEKNKDIRNIESINLAGHLYISFETDIIIDLFPLISRFSSFFALFEWHDGMLKPVEMPENAAFSDSINTILKYTGKTNEQFTRLLNNLAFSASKSTDSNKINLLDPLCGKGTTLYDGLMLGYNVCGVEINEQWFKEMQTYIIKYLENGKYKHKFSEEKRRNEKGQKIADIFYIKTAVKKELFLKEDYQNFSVICSETSNVDKFVKKNSFDALVADIPYGVQHASKTVGNDKKSPNLSRNPVDLIETALPNWLKVMKKGASIVLSFNEFTIKYDKLAEIFIKNNINVLSESPYYGYIHKVDQAINRNLIVGRYE